MRKMRPLWQYFLFVVPVIVVAFGMQFLSKHRGSRYLASSAPAARAGSGRELQDLQKALRGKIARMEADQDAPTRDLKLGAASKSGAAPDAGPDAGTKTGDCASVELPGAGPDAPPLTKPQWTHIMEQFHDAKALLTAWLSDHRSAFAPKTYEWMRARVADARLQRSGVPPVVDEEPDLSWRGIGVLAAEPSNAPLIRVGGGFAKLVEANPVRARFELARLLAQTWSPCEMSKAAGSQPGWMPWKGFLGCMQMTAQDDLSKDCAAGSVSQTGWAVSSALASVTSPPGCRLPAFDRAPASQCLEWISKPKASDKGVHL